MDKKALVEYLEGCKKLGKTTVSVNVDALLEILQTVPNQPRPIPKSMPNNIDMDGGKFHG